ncbi:hypothetical protein LMG8526HA_01388 [Lactococcus lactis]|uniref:hypothetical protein n=1 Tax=Lactococcus lactis TaxID=1358 RepID=UPI00071CE2C7|nr:hypothetical protein [Lactococcus lactis]KSU12102.1 hypothetical protein LMG8526_0902 [Lactococcus lactis subsp. lactis]MDU0400504.1 hypothetical protein [Lactococcus lactis]
MVKRKKNYRPLIILGSVGIFFVLFITILINGWINLGKYSVYYAQNLPHKTGTNPVMVAVFNNTDSIYIPNANDDVPFGGAEVKTTKDTISYFFAPLKPSYIYVEKSSTTDPTLVFERSRSSNYVYCIKNITDGYSYSYYFTGKGELKSKTKALYTNYDEIACPIIKQDFSQIKFFQNELYGTIVAHRQVPKINLQWLYNLLNYRRFN